MKPLALAFLFAAILCAACSTRPENNAEPAEAPAEKTQASNAQTPAEKIAPPDTAWHAELLAIAAEYRTYTKMAEDANWAPTMCRAPMHASPLVSKAEENTAHGRKLYYLWVKDAPAYPSPRWSNEASQSGKVAVQPAGQALVKESFQPGEGANPHGAKATRKLGDKADLFVMFKTDSKTPGTDAGWVYGTLTPDGKKVTSAGRVETCMGCHQNARHDRMFGLPAGGGKADKAE